MTAPTQNHTYKNSGFEVCLKNQSGYDTIKIKSLKKVTRLYNNVVYRYIEASGGDKMEDSQIIERFWERDESALSAVSEKYGKYCKTIARNIIGNEQ